MTCFIPRDITKIAPDDGHILNESSSITVTNLKPKWSKVLNSYVLNFKQRVKIPSVKNFILSCPNNSEEHLLLFGKVEESIYHLDFKAPFSPMQAFATALSSFDYTGT